MRLPSYVQRSRHGVFYVRVVIPPPIRAKLAGRREIRRSLGTRDPRTALFWAQRLSYKVSQWLHEARFMPTPDIEALVAHLRTNPTRKWEIDLNRGRFTADPTVPGDQEGLLQAMDVLGLRRPEALAILAAGGNGMDKQDRDRLSASSRHPLSEVSEEFLAAQFERTQNAKTRDDYRGTVDRFKALVGDKPVAAISVEDVAAFLAMGTKEGRKPKTLQKWISSLNTVLRDAQARGYIPANSALPTAPLSQQMKRLPVRRKERLAFEQSDLQIIFGEEWFLYRNSKFPNWFWLPVIALLSGVRIEECAQLRLTDICKDRASGLPYLDINEHGDKTVKTQASIRKIPLHPMLIELGILEYRDAIAAAGFADGRLFPCLPVTKYGDLSGSSSKHFNRYLREVGITDKRKVFHSFRHTVATALKSAGVRSEIRHRLLGHTFNQGEHATYIHADTPLKELYFDGIAKLQYEGLDLEFLKHDAERTHAWIARLKSKCSP